MEIGVCEVGPITDCRSSERGIGGQGGIKEGSVVGGGSDGGKSDRSGGWGPVSSDS